MLFDGDLFMSSRESRNLFSQEELCFKAVLTD